MRSIAAFALVFAVSCSGFSIEHRLYIACSGYASVLSELAGYKRQNLLTPSAIARVDAARSIANQICTQRVAEDIDVLEGAVKQMLTVKEEADGRAS
jgi:hypothetical protein